MKEFEFDVKFYQDNNGSKPVKEFLEEFFVIILVFFAANICMMVFAGSESNTFRLETIEFDNDRSQLYSFRDIVVETINARLNQYNKTGHPFLNNDDMRTVTYELVSFEDINFSHMYKLYTDVDEILAKNLIGEKALDVLREIEYIWVLKKHVEDLTFTTMFQRGKLLNKEVAYSTDRHGERLLSDEQIEEIIAQEGRWIRISTGIDLLDKRYEESVNMINKSRVSSIDNTIRFVTIPTLRTIAALVISEEDNYIYCFDEYIIIGSYGLSASSGRLNEFVEQRKLLEVFHKWYREPDANPSDSIYGVFGGGASADISESVLENTGDRVNVFAIVSIIVGVILSVVIVIYISKKKLAN